MPALRLLSLLALTLLLLPSASAQKPTARTGTPTATPMPVAITGYTRGTIRTLPVSGRTSDYMETLLAPGDGWLYGMEIGEKSDQPCYVGIWAVEGDVPAPGFPSVFDHCDGDATARSLGSVGFTYMQNQAGWITAKRAATAWLLAIPIYREVQTARRLINHNSAKPPLPIYQGQPVALDGVGICRRNVNDEMKGIRVYGSTLDLSGPTARTTHIVTTTEQIVAGLTVPPGARISEEFKRPLCSNSSGWEAIQTCNANEVVVGIDVHYKLPRFSGNQNRARITGLAPKCARVTIQRG